jgi:hypothetical protein
MGRRFSMKFHAPASQHWRGRTVGTHRRSDGELGRGMFLPMGRRNQRDRSWGRAKKRERMGKPMKVGGADVGSGWAVFIGELLIHFSSIMPDPSGDILATGQLSCRVPAARVRLRKGLCYVSRGAVPFRRDRLVSGMIRQAGAYNETPRDGSTV